MGDESVEGVAEADGAAAINLERNHSFIELHRIHVRRAAIPIIATPYNKGIQGVGGGAFLKRLLFIPISRRDKDKLLSKLSLLSLE